MDPYVVYRILYHRRNVEYDYMYMLSMCMFISVLVLALHICTYDICQLVRCRSLVEWWKLEGADERWKDRRLITINPAFDEYSNKTIQLYEFHDRVIVEGTGVHVHKYALHYVYSVYIIWLRITVWEPSNQHATSASTYQGTSKNLTS